MDSLKSIVVVAILLGVLYGIYQVINDDDSPVSPNSTNLMAEFDKEDPSAEKQDSDSESDEKSDSQKDETPLPSGDQFLTTVKPPPSTFDKESSRFVYPEKKDSRTDTIGADVKNNSPKSFVPDSKSTDQFDSLSKTGLANNNSDSAKMVPVNNGIYQPDAQPNKTFEAGALPTTAESNINDPRNRFVSGSFAEFEKQVLGDMAQAETLIKNKDFVGALKTLTKYFDDPRLTREENQNLVSWLDPLAGKVIYSVEHHLVDPYYVRQNDTLKLLSVKFGVPAELIFNINRVAIPDRQNLVAGTEIKMVKGPFNAEISLSKKRMTLFVKEMYAGTFSIRIGNEPVPKTGKYRVLSKSRLGQDYSDQNYQRIEAQSPNNPYGKYYLNIGGGMSIHGSAHVSDSNDRRGCISLNAIDAEDVHNILTTESTVTIVE